MNDNSSSLTSSFIKYRDYFDDVNDRTETIKRLGRDGTIKSKKIIFGLLRKNVTVEKRLKEALDKMNEVKMLFHSIAKELENRDSFQYLHAYKPGVEEFIEAATLFSYIENNCVISYNELQKKYFIFDDGVELLITPLDYLLGIGDLTGELMRHALNSVASGDKERCFLVYDIMKVIFHDYSILSNVHRQVSKKFDVMKNSLRKVEQACYTLSIQHSETPTHMLVQMMVDDEDIDMKE